MSQLNDCAFESTGTQGFSGAQNDRKLKWLQSQGATSNALTDAWHEFLDAQGVSHIQRNNMTFDWLIGLGISGQLNDQELEFWCEQGGIIGPGISRAEIMDDDRKCILVTFNGAVGGDYYTGTEYSLNNGDSLAFLPGPTLIGTNQVRYCTGADFKAGDEVDWLYLPGTLTVGGEALGAQDIIVINRISAVPSYTSGRLYESAGLQYAEITFNTQMQYTDYNGVTIKADGAPRAITAISGIGTNKITYVTSGMNYLNTVTWEYLQSGGNLENNSGDPLGDVTPQTLVNEIPSETFWDLTPPAEPGTFWDGNPPSETKWDLEA